MGKNKVWVVNVNEVHFDSEGRIDKNRLSYDQGERDIDSLTPQQRAIAQRVFMKREGSSTLAVIGAWIKRTLPRSTEPSSENVGGDRVRTSLRTFRPD